jgi:UDP-glucose 4-epimerase
MTPRLLVTGGAGCIGSDLAAELLLSGAQVVVMDNLSSGKREHIEPLLGNERFRFVEADLLDRASLDAAMSGVDMVWHLAANPDVKYAPGDPTDKDLQQNTLCTYNVLESMRLQGVRRIAFSSTSAVYGISDRQPIPEDAPTRPISLYGATKLGCEALLGAFSNLFGYDCWIFRLANIVGPKVRKRGQTVLGDVVDRLEQSPARLRIPGDGRQAKSYLLSEECVEAMLFAVRKASAGFHVFNLGCDDNLEVRRIAPMVADAMGLGGVEFEYTGGQLGWPGDVPRVLLDITAINRLGWRSRYTSEEAVALAIRSLIAGRRGASLCAS